MMYDVTAIVSSKMAVSSDLINLINLNKYMYYATSVKFATCV